jgi:hypothetical protein
VYDGYISIASQILLFLASLARHCALRRLPQHGHNNNNNGPATITASIPPTIATVPGYISSSMLQHNMPNSGSHSQLTHVSTIIPNPAPSTNTNTPTNGNNSKNHNDINSMTYHAEPEPAPSLSSPAVTQPHDYQHEIALASVSTHSTPAIDDDNEPNAITIRDA